MGFFDALRRVLTGDPRRDGLPGESYRPGEVDLGDSPSPEFPGRVPAADPAAMAAPPRITDYDRDQWRRKLKRILDQLPTSQGEWVDLMADAGALALDTDWVEHCQREEFALLVRAAVADRRVTLAEHSKLELARTLIGIPDVEAEATLHTIVAEAQEFFNKPIEGA
ncbi:MAG TPA: hypothetical protein VF590_14750 [Isosphaeraceae bacterium]|jgi:hypothetical protein